MAGAGDDTVTLTGATDLAKLKYVINAGADVVTGTGTLGTLVIDNNDLIAASDKIELSLTDVQTLGTGNSIKFSGEFDTIDASAATKKLQLVALTGTASTITAGTGDDTLTGGVDAIVCAMTCLK